MWLDFLVSTDIITEKLYCLSSLQENDTEDQIICVCVCVSVCMSVWVSVCVCVGCSVVSDSLQPKYCSLPGFSVHGIFQARILEWVSNQNFH